MLIKGWMIYPLQLFCRSRTEEFDSLSKGDIFKSFYSQLEEIQKYHKQFPGLVEKSVCSLLIFLTSQKTVEPVDLEKIFTGEEYYGKYLDLHSLFEKYINLPRIYRIDYVSYLTLFYKFNDIPMETKMGAVFLFFSELWIVMNRTTTSI